MPPKRAKATAAKHDLPDKSQAIDGPAKKKQKSGADTPTGGANNVITIDDDEVGPRPDKAEPKQKAGAKQKAEPKQKAKPRPKKDICIEPEPETAQMARIKPIFRPGTCFPRFSDGDVVIVLVDGSRKYSYQLHNSILERASPWFRNMDRLKMLEVEPDPVLAANHQLARKLLARYELEPGPGMSLPELRRSVLTYFVEAENLSAPEQSAQPPTRGHDDPQAKTPSAASASRSNSTISTDDMGGKNISKVQTNGDDSTMGLLKARSHEKLPLEVEAAISAPPDFNEVGTANDQAKSDDDVIMLNTESSVEEVVGSEAREVSDLAMKQPVLMKGDKSSSVILAPVAEEECTIKNETSDEDITMEEVSDTHIAESAKEDLGSQPPAQIVSSSNVSSDADVAVLATIEEDSLGSTVSQSPQAGFAFKDNDVVAPEPILAIKEEVDIQQEKLDDDTVKTHGLTNTINNAAEVIRGNDHSETSRAIETREDLTDNVPTPEKGSSLFNHAELSDVASGAVPDNCSDKQQMNIVSTPPQTIDKEILGDIESSDLLASGPGVQVDDTIKNEESATSLATEVRENMTGKDEKGGSGEPSCSGLDAALAVKVKDEFPKVVNCAYHTKQEEVDIEQKHCELLPGAEQKVEKEPGSFVTVGNFEDHFDKPLQNDCSGTRPSSIPQGDGPSEETTSNGHVGAQPSKTRRLTRQQSTIHQSNTPHNEHVPSVPEDAGQYDSTKASSLAQGNTQGAPKVRDGVAPLFSTEQSSGQPSSLAVQKIGGEQVQPAPAAMRCRPSIEYLDAHHNLFLIFYSRPPLIDSQDIGIALKQSENLIEVARLYGNIPIVRPYISNALMQFGRELYTAIKQDPPRWVPLAFYLESAPIFQECTVHIVANQPYWPWPTQDIGGPLTAVLYLFEKKLRSFETLKKSVNKSLFSNEISQAEVFSRALTKDDFDTWFVVQYWRDWFTRSLAKANVASESGQKCVRGKVYRDLRRGGEAYLPTILVLDAVEACRSTDLHTKAKRQGVERDLKTLKDFAQKAVEPLCVNYSMLSVEDAGIDYLTCIKVEDHELPWVNLDGNLMQSGSLDPMQGN